MWFERMLSMVRREVERTQRRLHRPPRMGLISSYDPKKHAVKVKLQPTGTESGWIPLTSAGVGNQFGSMRAPNIGDSVEVHFHGGDQMVPRIMTRHHNEKDQPPQLEAGEYLDLHQQGQYEKHYKDGTFEIGGPGSMKTGQPNQGKSGTTTTDSSAGDQNSANDQAQQQQNQQPQGLQKITLKPDGTFIMEAPKNDMTITVKNNNITITCGKDYSVTASGNVNITASGTMTLKAPTIVLAGNVKLGDAGASRLVSAIGTVDTGGFAEISNLLTKVWGI
jgi:uncharacterized protein involved in type VI secretion and phage assembly